MDHLQSARDYHELGDLRQAIWHAFWFAYHLGQQEGIRHTKNPKPNPLTGKIEDSPSTPKEAYEAVEFLLEITVGEEPESQMKECAR